MRIVGSLISIILKSGHPHGNDTMYALGLRPTRGPRRACLPSDSREAIERACEQPVAARVRVSLLKVMNASPADQLEALIRTQNSEQVLAVLSGIGVDAVRALSWKSSFTDPFARANNLTFVVHHKQFGRAAIVHSYSD